MEMYTMTEEQIFCDKFKIECAELQNKKIVLYGAGEKTRILLENVKDFEFVGILALDMEGENLYGKKVLSLQEVVYDRCVIIIVAREHITDIIYNRIRKFCQENAIGVYDIHGKQLPHDEKEYENPSLDYWKKDEIEVKRYSGSYNIISLDIFDTLVQRTVLNLDDMFELVECQSGIPKQFARYRKKAERECRGNYGIKEIYDKLKELTGWETSVIKKCCDTELQVECRGLSPRGKMLDILKWFAENGKEIYLVSDMYWPKNTIVKMLGMAGVENYRNLFVSCEEHKSKKDGELFETLKKYCGTNKIVHIGDNRYDDITMAEKKGLSAIQILSSYELLMLSDMRDFLNETRTLEDKIILGMLTAKIFSNPFILHEQKGKVYIRSMHTFTYCFLCPIVYYKNLSVDESIKKIYSEFVEERSRICGTWEGDGVSLDFLGALIKWLDIHVDRLTPDQKKLLNRIENELLPRK